LTHSLNSMSDKTLGECISVVPNLPEEYILSMSNSNESVEIEIKVRLASFMDYLKLVGYLGQIEAEDHHINGFFDSEDRQLAKGGWALRVRAEDHRGIVTIKSIARESGAAVIRQEIEAEIPRSQALDVLSLRQDVLSLELIPIQFIKGKFPQAQLAKLIQFENTRQKKLFRIADFNYLLEIDTTKYNDGSVEYELEVELKNPALIETVEAHLRKLFQTLEIPFERQPDSKFARALHKARIY
jgi:inorganic triphosphatase YgiF